MIEQSGADVNVWPVDLIIILLILTLVPRIDCAIFAASLEQLPPPLHSPYISPADTQASISD